MKGEVQEGGTMGSEPSPYLNNPVQRARWGEVRRGGGAK